MPFMEFTDQMTTVMTFDNWIAAHILRGKLESYEIPAYIHFEYYVSLLPLNSNAVGGIAYE
ncbi:MAG: hypothetical protein JWO06_1751 [Bacteroidota bacterium]|nr:hypothetical protein [Bacteroidota bacterium]